MPRKREETTIAKLLKSNDRMYADQTFRVIGANGEQLGLLKLGTACLKARDAGLDLVMVSETSRPPVCRIMDFGKLCYEQKKKLKDQKKSQQAQKVKEVKFRLNIDQHDYETKLSHAKEFLSDKNKLRVTIMFKGRELAHPEKGQEQVARIANDLDGFGVLDAPGKLLGRNISVTFSPAKNVPSLKPSGSGEQASAATDETTSEEKE